MNLASLLFALYAALAGHEHWRLVYSDGTLRELAGTPQLAAGDRTDLKAGWAWSGLTAPRRVLPDRIGRDKAPVPAKEFLTVRVVRQVPGKPPADLRVIAAPVEMWREVPEDRLPQWPVPASGKLTLPYDSSHRWQLRAAGSGEGSWWVELPYESSTALLTTLAAVDVRVAVLDEEGGRVQRAFALALEGRARQGRARPLALVRTEEGLIELAGLPDAEQVTLGVQSPHLVPATLRGWPSELPREVRLRRGAVLSGRVTTEDGKPVAKAALRIEAWLATEVAQLASAHTKSGEDGKWTIAGIVPGKIALDVKAPGFAPWNEQMEVEAGPRDLGDIQLQAGLRLAVAVVDDEGAPVVGAEIRAGPGLTAISDAEGKATFETLPPAAVQLNAYARRHLPRRFSINPPFPDPARLVLPRAYTIIGLVFDPETSTPVTAGRVRLRQSTWGVEEQLDGAGRFEVDLFPGELAQGEITTPEHSRVTVQVSPGKAGQVREIHYPLLRGAALAGRVVRDEDGAPILGARVWMPRPGDDGPAIAWARGDLLAANTNEMGEFRLTGLPAGAALLRVDAPGRARAHLQVERQSGLAMDAVQDVGEIRLTAGATVVVHVADSPTQAVARADLRGAWLEPDMLTALVVDGAATLRAVPPGRATISVLAGPKLLCNEDVEVPAGGELAVDCRLTAPRLHGTVKIGGAPASSGTLMWIPPGGEDLASWINTRVSEGGLKRYDVVGAGRPQVDVPVQADGSFATDEVTPGRWGVAWIPASGGSASAPRELVIPPVEELETVLDFPGLAISGVVLDEEGRPAEGATVRELARGGTAFSGAGGAFWLVGVELGSDGRLSLQAGLEGLLSQVSEVTIEPGRAPEPVVLTLGRGRLPRLEVAVLTAEGQPAAGAFVFLEEEGLGLRIVSTDGSGRAAATFTGQLPKRVRAAVTSGAGWAFGDWTPWEEARRGLVLALNSGGGLELASRTASGSPRILSPAGWDVSRLLRIMSAPPHVAPDAPLLLSGLPAGSYTVSLNGASTAVSVREGEQARAHLE